MSRIIDTIRRRGPEERHAPASGGRTGEPELGFVQYFHKGDRVAVEQVIRGLERVGATQLRTAVSWADWESDGGEAWFEWLLAELTSRFTVLPCVLYTPPEQGMLPKTSSPPREPERYADFVEGLLERYRGDFQHVELWNEPNNYIEWDWTVDPEWNIFARMIGLAAERAAGLGAAPVLGGMSPLDPNWLDLMFKRGAMEHIAVVGIHGFPGTWEAVWDGWAAHIDRVQEVLDKHDSDARVWVTEAGFSTWSHDEFRQLDVMVDLARAPVDRAYWYSVQDLAPERSTLDGFHADERAYHFGIQRTTGTPKLLARLLGAGGIDAVREMVSFVRLPGPAPGGRRASLITGGAGFIGTNLADKLASNGRQVVVLDSLARPGVEDNLRWLKAKHGDLISVEPGDVRDVFALRRALIGCDRVFHLASQVAVTTSLQDPVDDFDINLRGTVNLLEEIRRLDEPPALLFTSTNKVYGRLADVELIEDEDRYQPADEVLRGRGISEKRPLEFCSPYGCSKGGADQYVLDYARSFDLPAVVFRMSCIYGPHQRGTEDQGWVAHFLFRMLRDETITIYGDGKQVRDVLFVQDLVEAMLLATLPGEPDGRVFNIGGGVPNAVSLLQVLSLLQEVTGREARVEFAPWRLADQPYYVSNTSSFRDSTGWEPRVVLEEGLEQLHAWAIGSEARRDLIEAGPARRR